MLLINRPLFDAFAGNPGMPAREMEVQHHLSLINISGRIFQRNCLSTAYTCGYIVISLESMSGEWMLCLEWSKLTRLIFLIHLDLSILFSDFHTFDLHSVPAVRPALGWVSNEICGDRTSDDISGFRLLHRNIPQNWQKRVQVDIVNA